MSFYSSLYRVSWCVLHCRRGILKTGLISSSIRVGIRMSMLNYNEIGHISHIIRKCHTQLSILHIIFLCFLEVDTYGAQVPSSK